MMIGLQTDFARTSLPSRERGLKFWLFFEQAVAKMSLPSRERGLKFIYIYSYIGQAPVAPLAGAWIEITKETYFVVIRNVAPLAGAWIEIAFSPAAFNTFIPSLPSRERGLKFSNSLISSGVNPGRSPRGSVD